MENLTTPSSSGKKKKKRSKKAKQWRDLFTDKFIDLVIVIVSILIAYELTVWQTEADHRSTEKYYVESMLTDLNKDVKEMEQNLKELRHDSVIVANYISHINEWPDDSLATTFMDVMSLETFTYNSNTYQSLVSGNGLNTFSDRALRTQITEYYNLYVSIFRFEQIYTDLIFRINAQYIDEVDYLSRKVRTNAIDKVTTRNFLLLAIGQLKDAIEGYEDALEKATELKQSLESSF